ncbi:MAG TPA: hypothetical protein VLN49_06355 [Gemmatimonadaceae bacterium]|nr:hypothetical protein [Gemmatimonadaceae bacterium]
MYVAVVGPGDSASVDVIADATEVGGLIAQRGWITLTGGRSVGVMAAAAAGARAAGGLAIGLLPGSDRSDAAPDLAVALPTGLGEARNAVLVTAADAVIACGANPGTASEIALALKANKPIVLVKPSPTTAAFFSSIAGDAPFRVAHTPAEAVEWVAAQLRSASR